MPYLSFISIFQSITEPEEPWYWPERLQEQEEENEEEEEEEEEKEEEEVEDTLTVGW